MCDLKRIQITALFLIVMPFFGAADQASADHKKSAQENLFKRAEEHYFHRRFYTAKRILNRILEREPENARAYSYLGDIYLITGKLKKAEEHIRIAIELSKHPDREFYRLGQVLYLKKDAEGALRAYKEALKINPRLHICRFQMGLVYFRLKRDKQKTIAHWTAFRKLKPEDPQGPAIDRALELLKRTDFILPDGKIELPKGADSRIPYKKAPPAQEKVNNKKEDIINIDEL